MSGGAGRKKNPVPASRKLSDETYQAKRLFAEFTGHDATRVNREEVPDYSTYIKVGKVDAICYTTNRDGKVEHYKHTFRRQSRPLLVASHDGKDIRLLRGAFRFTNRGIVDHDAAGNPVE